MTIAWVDRTIFNATAAGLGDFVVASAVQGYLTPTQSNAVDSFSYHYAAQLVDGNSGNITDWEVGTGVWTSATSTLARTTVEFSSNGNAKVNFSKAPQVMLTALAEDFGVIVNAPSDLTWYVATTGNDNNLGTVGSPFLTINHALSVASKYNWQNLYQPTINIADGTYAENVLLPFLINPKVVDFGGSLLGNTSVWTNVVVQSITTEPNSLWLAQGFSVNGTLANSDNFGVGISLGNNSYLACDAFNINVGAGMIGIAEGNQAVAEVGYNGFGISVSSTNLNIFWLQFGGAGGIQTICTFNNPITMNRLFDAEGGGLNCFGIQIVNGSNITASVRILAIRNVDLDFETGTVDGNPLTLANFPGGGVIDIEPGCSFRPYLVSFTKNTIANILKIFPLKGLIAFATDLGVTLLADGTNWNIDSSYYTTQLDAHDLGALEFSNRIGYGKDYVTDKNLVNCFVGIGSKPGTVSGQIRWNPTANSNGTIQVYNTATNAWENFVSNLDLFEIAPRGILAQTPVGHTSTIEVFSGDSTVLGLNGLPIIQGYQVDLGAYPAKQIINGGTF